MTKEKIKPAIEGWLKIIWQNGEERALMAKRTQGGSPEI